MQWNHFCILVKGTTVKSRTYKIKDLYNKYKRVNLISGTLLKPTELFIYETVLCKIKFSEIRLRISNQLFFLNTEHVGIFEIF